MIIPMHTYIKNIMKINNIIIIINILIIQLLIGSSVNYQKNSLNEIEIEIQSLEGELKKQIETQKSADEKLKEIKIKIIDEKNKFLKNQNEEINQSQLLTNINNVLDSLKKNSSTAEAEKEKIKKLITEIEINNESINSQIIILNEDLNNIKNRMNNTADTLMQIKKNIKSIIKENIFIKSPNDIEFIIESSTWNDYILHTVLYNMTLNSKKELIEKLFKKQKKIEAQYNQNLKLQNTMIGNKKILNNELKEYQILESRLSDNLIIIENVIKEKESIYSQILDEYKIISRNLNISENKINLLTKEKNNIKNIQKKADDEKQRIEYALILKKESRDKVEKEIKKLLLQESKYKGMDISGLKNKLPWPIDGEIIKNFGIHVSPTGTKFDYTYISIVGNKILHLVNEINPKNPNKELVKKFQKITMNLKNGDVGYGVFGPQTTKKWKEYNELKLMKKQKKSILAIHDGKVEQIKFIDPITGVLIIIRHNNQSLSTYSGHIDLIVSENDIVSSGQKIGFIKEENILAFTLLVNGEIVNPINWLIKK